MKGGTSTGYIPRRTAASRSRMSRTCTGPMRRRRGSRIERDGKLQGCEGAKGITSITKPIIIIRVALRNSARYGALELGRQVGATEVAGSCPRG